MQRKLVKLYKSMNTTIITTEEKSFIESLKQIVRAARRMAYTAIDYAQIQSNWLIGQRVVEQMQKGAERAEYGAHVIKIASDALTEEFGSGYSETNIRNFRTFYLTFNDLQIQQTPSAKSQMPIQQTLSDELEPTCKPIGQTLPARLSWSHYERLMRVDDEVARKWYMREASEQMWSVRTLNRNINTQYYERLLMSQIKEPVIQEMQEKTAEFQHDKLEFIKNPTVLEFLGIAQNKSYQEKDLEQAILNNLSEFLMEMGKGFAFVARQQLIRTEAEDYYIDLVFYNYILKCFLLVDLKTSRITHQDVGQMDMYVRMYDQLKRTEGDNPTIGLILCSETSEDMARYSVMHDNERLFQAKYLTFLPTVEQLREEIELQKSVFRSQQGE